MSITKFIREEMEAEDQEGEKKESRHLVNRESFDYDTAHHSMICSGCSCMCDDISYFLKNGKIIKTLNLCEVAMKRLRTVADEERIPTQSGDELSENIKKAAGILKDNGPCLIIGSDGMCESVIHNSCDLAKSAGGVVLPWMYPAIRNFYSAADNFGWHTALLDEIRDQADMVFMWRCDPLDTHHRHLSRYSLFARGRNTERGHGDRNFVGIASEKPIYEPLCQQYFEMDQEKDVQFILALMNPPQSGPPDHRDFPLLKNAIQRASFTAVFVDPAAMTQPALEALFEWSAEINREGIKRHIIMPLWRAGANISGFIQKSLELQGCPRGVDFSGNNVIDEKTDWEGVASSVKSVLMIESGPAGGHREKLPQCLEDKPRVIITPFKQPPETDAGIVIPAALPGIESSGIFTRADGLPLQSRALKGLMDYGYPSAESILEKLRAEVLK